MCPTRSEFTRREWAVIEQHRTPTAVQRFLNGLTYNDEPGQETLRSFRGVVRAGAAHCLEASLSAAVILEQHGFEPLLLDLESQDQLDHVVFLYRRRGLWGSVARSRDPGLHGRRPVFERVRDLVDSYFDPFVDLSGRITGFGICQLADLGEYDWRLSRRNVWKVQQHLIEMPHAAFPSSERRYQYWLGRYREYRRLHPLRKPVYYPGRSTWKPGCPRGG